MNLATKLSLNLPLRVLFINDNGFRYGAGIAMMRQIMAFLHRGDTVMGMCFEQGEVEGQFDFNTSDTPGEWLGMLSLPKLNFKDAQQGLTSDVSIELLVMKAAAAYPDVIIFGNIHSAPWPIDLIPAMKRLGCPVIVYMHDCWYATGRCAYPGPCRLYQSQSGCDETCPTAHEYPVLEPAHIHNAWAQRRAMFENSQGIALAANSQWTLNVARSSMPAFHFADVVRYGIDSEAFTPGDKREARRTLGIPEDKFIILSGAVNLEDPRKGGKFIEEIAAALAPDAYTVVFGHNSSLVKGVHTIKLQRDQTRMPAIFRAADLFVNTPLDEAFGQTMLEASATGIPTVSFRVGGIVEIARHGVNSRLADVNNVAQIIEDIRWFIDNPDERENYGRRGRAIVEEEFTLAKQAESWTHYLKRLAEQNEETYSHATYINSAQIEALPLR